METYGQISEISHENRSGIMMKIIYLQLIIGISILFYTGQVYAQNKYRTSDGYVLVTGYYLDSAFIAESHKLNIDYDPETKNYWGSIRLESFITGITFIDSLITKNPNEIIFSGNIPVDFLTWHHIEYNLNLPMEIEVNESMITANAKISLKHADLMMNYICIMESNFDIRLNDLKVIIPEEFGPIVNVQFLQLILRKSR